MKIVALVILSVITLGCSSNEHRQDMFTESVTACNTVCENNPEIAEFSTSEGVFMGKAETSCKCRMQKKEKM